MFMSWGIYLDSYAGGYTVTRNVAYRSSHGGVMLQGGKDNRVENNIFVDGTSSQVYVNNFGNNSSGQVFQRNIVSYTDPDAALLSGGRLDDSVICIDRNLYFPAGGKEPLIHGCASFATWQKRGFDRNSLIADPRFVDPAHDDYALRPDSPALQLGFEPIDTSKVGLLRDRCRCSIRPAAADFWLIGTRNSGH
jgi:parallel beta-helix repeat protein